MRRRRRWYRATGGNYHAFLDHLRGHFARARDGGIRNRGLLAGKGEIMHSLF